MFTGSKLSIFKCRSFWILSTLTKIYLFFDFLCLKNQALMISQRIIQLVNLLYLVSYSLMSFIGLVYLRHSPELMERWTMQSQMCPSVQSITTRDLFLSLFILFFYTLLAWIVKFNLWIGICFIFSFIQTHHFTTLTHGTQHAH